MWLPALTETDVCLRTLQLSASLGWGLWLPNMTGAGGVENISSSLMWLSVCPVSKSQSKFYHRVPQNKVAAF